MSTVEKNKENYNEVPYTSKAYSSTQPLTQKIILGLLGQETPNLKKARVLEIGCSFGGNLIAFAISNPEAEVVGIDLSETQIEEGKKIVEKLGLNNLKLYALDILDYNNEFGKFDYIISHGVYSWVPEIVQNKILEVIKSSLTENGSAVVSYNTYPGWKRLDVLKDFMLLRNKIINSQGYEIEKSDVVKYGRGALEFLKKYSFLEEKLLKDIDIVISKPEYYLYHEFFEIENRPIYLFDFNNKLMEKGLVHICDSYMRRSFPPVETEEWYEALKKEVGYDFVAKEQYYDFIYNTQFRTSIITHLDNINNFNSLLEEKFEVKNLIKYHIRGKFNFAKDGKITSFNNQNLNLKGLNEELLRHINDIYPNTISIKEISEKFNESLQDLPLLILDKLVEIFDEKVEIELTEKPKLGEKYRKYLEIMLNLEKEIIGFSSPLGYELSLSEIEKRILLEFDGKNSKDEIVNKILNLHHNDEIVIKNFEKDVIVEDEEVIKQTIEDNVSRLADILQAQFLIY